MEREREMENERERWREGESDGWIEWGGESKSERE